MSCAGWNSTKYKQYSYIIKMKLKKLNKVEKLTEKMHYFKNSDMKQPIKELSFFILYRLKSSLRE